MDDDYDFDEGDIPMITNANKFDGHGIHGDIETPLRQAETETEDEEGEDEASLDETHASIDGQQQEDVEAPHTIESTPPVSTSSFDNVREQPSSPKIKPNPTAMEQEEQSDTAAAATTMPILTTEDNEGPSKVDAVRPQQSGSSVRKKEEEEKKENVQEKPKETPRAVPKQQQEKAPNQETKSAKSTQPEPLSRSTYQKYKTIIWCLLILCLVFIVVVLVIFNLRIGSNDSTTTNNNGNIISNWDTFPPTFATPTTPNPTVTPGMPTVAPTTAAPTRRPTPSPTKTPTSEPTTLAPTMAPSMRPTVNFKAPLKAYLESEFAIDTTSNEPVIEFMLQEALQRGNGALELTPKLAQRFALLKMDVSLFGTDLTNFWNENRKLIQLNSTRWGSDQDECAWKGITCNNSSQIVKIELGQEELDGRIPTEIGLLSQLSFLDLSDNRLQGTIPEELYNCLALEKVFLYRNKLTGTISESISQLWDLKAWNLSVNRLTGTIPSTMKSGSRGIFRMETFNVYDNQMTGTIPNNLKLRFMFYFDLGRNQFSGTLPKELGLDFVRLRYLYLDFNRFTGPVPLEVVNAGDGRLLSLTLNDNQFTGILPGNHIFITEMNQYMVQNNLFSGMEQRTCMLNVLETGEMAEFKSDCNICICGKNNQLCRNCYN